MTRSPARSRSPPRLPQAFPELRLRPAPIGARMVPSSRSRAFLSCCHGDSSIGCSGRGIRPDQQALSTSVRCGRVVSSRRPERRNRRGQCTADKQRSIDKYFCQCFFARNSLNSMNLRSVASDPRGVSAIQPAQFQDRVKGDIEDDLSSYSRRPQFRLLGLTAHLDRLASEAAQRDAWARVPACFRAATI